MSTANRRRLPELRPASSVAAINAYIEERHGGGVQCCMARGKERVLVATRDFAPGEVLFVEPPLHIVRDEAGGAAFEALKAFCSDWEDGEDEVQWYWCGLRSLVAAELGEATREGCQEEATWPPLDPERRDRFFLLTYGGVGNSRPSRRTVQVAGRFAPHLRDPEVLERCVQVWKFNAFDCSEDDVPGAALYFLPSFLSHSCLPSACWHPDSRDGYVLRTRRAIAKGEEVTVSYLGEDSLLDHATARRLELFESKEFWCACERCSAAQDHSRGFLCPACQQGTIFARTPRRAGARDGEDDSDEDSDGAAREPSWIQGQRGRDRVDKVAGKLRGAACGRCKQRLGPDDAHRLAEQECQVRAAAEGWSKKSFRPGLGDLEDLCAFIGKAFSQHAAAYEAYGILARPFHAAGATDRQLELLRLRAEFAAAAFPGLSAAHAWSLDFYADALVAAAAAAPAGWRRPPEERGQHKHLKLALDAYTEAIRILALMFGSDHEYARAIERKVSRAREQEPHD